jgi:hypothetical protein
MPLSMYGQIVVCPSCHKSDAVVKSQAAFDDAQCNRCMLAWKPTGATLAGRGVKCDCGAGTGQIHRDTCTVNEPTMSMADGNDSDVQIESYGEAISRSRCGERNKHDLAARAKEAPEQVRGATHGDYTNMSLRIQTIKSAMHSGPQWDNMSPGQREALELIATKIGRIVCGDPNHHDHWRDIVGYATLALDRIEYKK